MHCPNCGSINHSESEVCTQCGAPAGGQPADQAAAEKWARVLRERYYSGRRNTIVGLLLLCGACLIMLGLMSKGLAPFLAFLWTCWLFLWGVIALAEGSARWLSSHRQIKALACANSQHPGGSKTETCSDQALGQPGQNASQAPFAEGERPSERPLLLDKAGSG